jgi:xanthine/CO dehydrogenase XdhC/CoxF family maturation factor
MREPDCRKHALLEQLGVSADSIARLPSPIELIQGALRRATLALGIVAEIVLEAKARGYVP